MIEIADMLENPSATEIMEEVRQGLSDTTLSDATTGKIARSSDLPNAMRQAHAHAPVLGRCDGSLRGKCCKMLAPMMKPITEQLNLFHNAVLKALEHFTGTQPETDARIRDLEARLQKLESQEPSKRES